MHYYVRFLALLTMIVIALGAYTRLSDAGLGCPDWPGCYGAFSVPSTEQALAKAEASFQQTVEPVKAWIEMVHRYLAFTLALGILSLLCLGLYDAIVNRHIPWLLLILSGVLILQALLGRWTVTLKLYPPIIVLHLLGGLTVLCLLWWHSLSLKHQTMENYSRPLESRLLERWLWLGLVLLLLQIVLGGWTSANYAALICPDFPYCQGQWLPPLTWQSIWPSLGSKLDNTTLVTIHMMHRLGAVVTGTYLLSLGVILMVRRQIPYAFRQGILLVIGVITQISLGILNIVLLLPMVTAVGHNMMAMLLVLILLTTIHHYRALVLPSNAIRLRG